MRSWGPGGSGSSVWGDACHNVPWPNGLCGFWDAVGALKASSGLPHWPKNRAEAAGADGEDGDMLQKIIFIAVVPRWRWQRVLFTVPAPDSSNLFAWKGDE